ncbi:MAG: hypothetical protein LBM69_05690, partial [Lachnospiraceae bacterium]|nr:hypothetical protein [Lachnospiraceae bacterium]
PDAILHELYHSGTACASPDIASLTSTQYSLVDFAKKCIAQGIDFYAAPYDSRNPMYDSSKRIADTGVAFLRDISITAAYTKLLIAYGSFSDHENRKRFLETDIACEHFVM